MSKTIVFQPEVEAALKKAGAKGKCIANIKACRLDDIEYLCSSDKYDNIFSFLNSAFVWNDTPEGFEFWDKIADSK